MNNKTKEFLEKLAELMEEYSAEFYYVQEHKFDDLKWLVPAIMVEIENSTDPYFTYESFKSDITPRSIRQFIKERRNED